MPKVILTKEIILGEFIFPIGTMIDALWLPVESVHREVRFFANNEELTALLHHDEYRKLTWSEWWEQWKISFF